jgi:hypothetical protein
MSWLRAPSYVDQNEGPVFLEYDAESQNSRYRHFKKEECLRNVDSRLPSNTASYINNKVHNCEMLTARDVITI